MKYSKAIAKFDELRRTLRIWDIVSFRVKATSHLTIDFHAWQRETGRIQRDDYHHGNWGPSLTGKTWPVSLIFTHRTHRDVKTRWVRSSLKLQLQDAFIGYDSFQTCWFISYTHNKVASIQKNRDDKSHRVIVALSNFMVSRLMIL